MKSTAYSATLVLSILLLPFPQETHDAREILSKAHEAAGGSAWDRITTSHVTMKISTGGVAGTAEAWEDHLTGRSRNGFELGPMKGEEGFDGDIMWSRDSSGQVQRRQGGEEKEGQVNTAYRTALAYWYPERWSAGIEYRRFEKEKDGSFHVIEIVPEGGRSFDLWIDAESWLVDRTVEDTGIETRTTFFSDYRNIEGVTYPFAQRSTNGQEQYDLFATVDSVEFNVPIEDGLFSMPAPPPPDYSFPEGTTSITVPFDFLNNHIYVEAKLNGRGPFLVLCDTGGANVITPTIADQLGLEPEGAFEARGAGDESEKVSMVKVDSLTIGDVTIRDQLFIVFPLESFSAIEGVPQSGLIGYEIFKRFIVKIDYERKLLSLTLPEAFHYEGNGTVVPFVFDGRIPQVEGSIDGITGSFHIDTGSRSTLTLMGPFVEKHDLISKYSPDIKGVTGWGVGGPVRSYITRTETLELGGVEFTSPVTQLSLQTGGAFTDTYVAGNVGAGLLKQFNIIFDYTKQHMILEPNSYRNIPEQFDRSGMWINAAGDEFEIIDVIENGPASEAGLRPGDRIISIDGKPASRSSLPEIRHRFRNDPAGTEIRLDVRREGEEENRTVTLILEKLV